jgi:hypothetical protein
MKQLFHLDFVTGNRGQRVDLLLKDPSELVESESELCLEGLPFLIHVLVNPEFAG